MTLEIISADLVTNPTAITETLLDDKDSLLIRDGVLVASLLTTAIDVRVADMTQGLSNDRLNIWLQGDVVGRGNGIRIDADTDVRNVLAVNVAATAYVAGSNGIDLGGRPTVGTSGTDGPLGPGERNDVLEITNAGEIHGGGGGRAVTLTQGAVAQIDNTGLISGTARGVYIRDNDVARVLNTGTILGGLAEFDATSVGSQRGVEAIANDVFELVNTGLIFGGFASIDSSAELEESVSNSGRLGRRRFPEPGHG